MNYRMAQVLIGNRVYNFLSDNTVEYAAYKDKQLIHYEIMPSDSVHFHISTIQGGTATFLAEDGFDCDVPLVYTVKSFQEKCNEKGYIHQTYLKNECSFVDMDGLIVGYQYIPETKKLVLSHVFYGTDIYSLSPVFVFTEKMAFFHLNPEHMDAMLQIDPVPTDMHKAYKRFLKIVKGN